MDIQLYLCLIFLYSPSDVPQIIIIDLLTRYLSAHHFQLRRQWHNRKEESYFYAHIIFVTFFFYCLG